MIKKTPLVPQVFYIDGGSRGNPGPAGYGVVVKNVRGETIDTLFQFLGTQTNNVAEYSALIAALEYALVHHLTEVRIFSDSELLVRQLIGRYRVKSSDLRPLYDRAQSLIPQIRHFHIEHIPREQNREADALANQAMDGGGRKPPPREVLRFQAVAENGLLRPLTPVRLPDKKVFECTARLKE